MDDNDNTSNIEPITFIFLDPAQMFFNQEPFIICYRFGLFFDQKYLTVGIFVSPIRWGGCTVQTG